MAVLLAALIAAAIDAQTPGPTMKAIVAHQWGGPVVLKVEEVLLPQPKENEILIKSFAAGVNSFDGTLLTGKYAKVFGTQLPWIPGYDVAGTVEKVGANVRKFKAGDPVYAFISIPNGGGYAEYALAKENQAALKPATLSFAEAAGVPSVALTAWQSLIDKANVQPGQTGINPGSIWWSRNLCDSNGKDPRCEGVGDGFHGQSRFSETTWGRRGHRLQNPKIRGHRQGC